MLNLTVFGVKINFFPYNNMKKAPRQEKTAGKSRFESGVSEMEQIEKYAPGGFPKNLAPE